MLKYITDGRGNIQLVPVPGYEDTDTLMDTIRLIQGIDPDELARALSIDVSQLRAEKAVSESDV